MILTGPEITRQRGAGRVVIEPFNPAQVNPNSYNVLLGPTLIRYTSEVLDTRKPNPFEEIEIPEAGFVLQPDEIYLGATVEVIGGDHFVPIIRSRSSAARLGLFSHCTADLIDIGSVGQLTLQLHAVQPLRVYAGDSLGQVTFWRPEGEIVLYDGKYQGSRGPQPSQVHRDALAAA